MDEADEHPASDQLRLELRDGLEQGQVGVRRIRGLRVVAGDGVVGQPAQERRVRLSRGGLEGAPSQVAGGHPAQARPGAIGMASCRGRWGESVWNSVGAQAIKKKN